MSPYEVWSLAVAVVATVINLGALTFVGLQVRQGARDTRAAAVSEREESDQRHRESTLQFYLATVGHRAEQRRSLPDNYDADAVARFLAEVPNDARKMTDLRGYLSLYELLATGVNAGALDRGVVERFDKAGMLRLWDRFGTWIETERLRIGNPYLYIEIQELVASLGWTPPPPPLAR